jgi:acetylornithine deacetylase/succinyl-diaminopimelate desuccinylase-like protein
MKRFIALAMAGVLCGAAEPDWRAVESHALDLLQRYLRVPSVNPPADTREAAALIHKELAAAGLEPKLYAAGPEGKQVNVLVRLPGRDRRKKPLLLLNHLDVVPVDRAAWTVDPFGGVVKDGWIWGRGALDMKGIGVMQLTALVTMKKMGIVPARDIVMLSTADEETNGTYGVRYMAQQHRAEIDAEYVLDEGGVGTRDILARDKLVFGIAVGEKQTAWVRISAKGTAAHGSQPIADNANLTLLEAIRKALAETGTSKKHPVVAEMISNIGPLAQNKFTNAIQKNTMSLTTLRAGVGDPPKANVIPSASEATIDCRLLPGVNAQEFVSDIRARINDPRVSVELLSTPDDPGASNSKTPLFEAIRKAILKVHTEAVVTPILVPFGTDSVKLRVLGMTAYGLTPMVLDAPTHATMHSDEERIPVEEFYKGIRIFYELLQSDF